MGQAGIEPRRLPRQARSRERVDRILDAAAELLVERGYDAVKTNHIAKRADVSIGSIYQFFPNRYAIFHALAIRYLDRVADIMTMHMGPDAPERPWREVLEDVLDILGELWRSERAFHAVWAAIQNTAELRESQDHYNDLLVNDTLMEFLVKVIPQATPEKRNLVGMVLFETCQKLLDYSILVGKEKNSQVIEELKVIAVTYLSAQENL